MLVFVFIAVSRWHELQNTKMSLESYICFSADYLKKKKTKSNNNNRTDMNGATPLPTSCVVVDKERMIRAKQLGSVLLCFLQCLDKVHCFLVNRKNVFWSVKKSSHLSSKVFFWNKSRKKPTGHQLARISRWNAVCCVCVCLLNELIHYRQLSSKSYKSSAVAEMGDHLATIDMGRKVQGGGCCAPFSGGSWVLIYHNMAWAEAYLHTKRHLDPSNHLVTIHQHYRQDRQTRQRSHSIGEPLFVTVAQRMNESTNQQRPVANGHHKRQHSTSRLHRPKIHHRMSSRRLFHTTPSSTQCTETTISHVHLVDLQWQLQRQGLNRTSTARYPSFSQTVSKHVNWTYTWWHQWTVSHICG